jgi:glycosyltransferase involved in cell wall biosynthesis
VAPNVGSISDIVLDGKSGTLTKTDSAEMAVAVGKLVDSAALRAQYGEAGRIHANQNFSLAKSLTDHGLLYDFSQHK